MNSAWQELKNSALKFPAFFSGTIVAAVSATLSVCSNDIFSGQYEALRKSGASYDSEPYSALRERENAFSENASFLALSAVWCCAASFFAEMLCRFLCAKKDIQGKKKALIHAAGQVLSAVLSVPIFFLLKSESDWRPFVYGSSLFIFVAMGLWMLHKFQDEEKVVPNAVVSLVMQGITVTCLVLGLLLVIFAFKNLIYSFSNNIPFAACFFFSSFVIGMNLLVSCVTRPRERVSIPKAFNVIVSCALLPIYAMLLLVLYVYFAKCIFTRSMPVGMVNPFVSAATAVYLFFYLALPREGTFSAAGKFLRRWGSVFLLPLIALQCFSFGIRIREYGFTLSRVASLYYIIASIVFCILPFVKKGKYMKSVYLVLSLAAFLMAVPGTGCISIALFSQTSRIVGITRHIPSMKMEGLTLQRLRLFFLTRKRRLLFLLPMNLMTLGKCHPGGLCLPKKDISMLILLKRPLVLLIQQNMQGGQKVRLWNFTILLRFTCLQGLRWTLGNFPPSIHFMNLEGGAVMEKV